MMEQKKKKPLLYSGTVNTVFVATNKHSTTGKSWKQYFLYSPRQGGGNVRVEKNT
jgi:hypothetical protein